MNDTEDSPDIIRGEGGRYIDISGVQFEDDDDRAELIELFKRVYISLGHHYDDDPWEITVGPDDSDGWVVIPLATLVRETADDCTPGAGSDDADWDELASLAAHLHALAAEIDTTVKNRDTSGHARAFAHLDSAPPTE